MVASHSKRREILRDILSGSECLSPASVHDPLSARIAQNAGFRFGLLSGSVVAATTLAAPDCLVHTLTEFAEQIRRIVRASNLSILTDADNGFGNALMVMRTVEEFEHAGVSGLSIEDTAAPSFGARDAPILIQAEEMSRKLRAALAARQDPSLVIAARTKSIALEGLNGALDRVREYAATGVDAIWLVTVDNADQLEAVRAVTNLPLIVGTNHGSLTRTELAALGGRIMLQGHLPIAAAVRALVEIYARLQRGDEPADLKGLIAAPEQMDHLVGTETYRERMDAYL